MFQKALQKHLIDLTVVTAMLYYAPESTLLQLESLKMILQYAASIYPTAIPDSN